MPDTTLDLSKHCTFEKLDSGVYYFFCRKATRRAVDEYFTTLESLFSEHPPHEPFRFIVDLRMEGMPPFAYTMQRSREMLDRLRYTAGTGLPQQIRVVYLHDNNPIMHTLSVFLSAMRIGSERLILNGATPEDATAWLLSDARAREVM